MCLLDALSALSDHYVETRCLVLVAFATSPAKAGRKRIARYTFRDGCVWETQLCTVPGFARGLCNYCRGRELKGVPALGPTKYIVDDKHRRDGYDQIYGSSCRGARGP